MKKLSKTAIVLVAAGTLSSGVAQATLFDRGGGLLYDDVLDVTWLQDANYAKTSGYDPDGVMNWNAANTWASSLDISRFVGESLTGWRLAANTPVGSDWDIEFSSTGGTDNGFNNTSPGSELSYMYYVNLGLKGYYSSDGNYQPDYGIFGDGTSGGQNNVGPVKNLQSNVYWSGTSAPPLSPDLAWIFLFDSGWQYYNSKNSEFHAWAVRPGDVAAVPEPETYALLLAGLGLLGVIARRQKNKQL